MMIDQNIPGQAEVAFPKGDEIHIQRHFRFKDSGQQN